MYKYKLTEEEFWNAVNTSENSARVDSEDYVDVIYYGNGSVETAYQVDTDEYEFVMVYEYDNGDENEYYGTK